LINGASSTHGHRVQKVPPQNKKIAHNRLLLLEIDSVAKVQLSGGHPALPERTGKPPWCSDRNRRFVIPSWFFSLKDFSTVLVHGTEIIPSTAGEKLPEKHDRRQTSADK
jgi:hypothetical protein